MSLFEFFQLSESHSVPDIVYHSSPTEFERFDVTKTKELGFHFGDKAQADHRGALTGGTTRAYHIDVKSPLKLRDALRWDIPSTLGVMKDAGVFGSDVKELERNLRQQASKLAKETGRNMSSCGAEVLGKYIMSLGYDCIEYENAGETSGTSWIVLDPDKISKADIH